MENVYRRFESKLIRSNKYKDLEIIQILIISIVILLMNGGCEEQDQINNDMVKKNAFKS